MKKRLLLQLKAFGDVSCKTNNVRIPRAEMVKLCVGFCLPIESHKKIYVIKNCESEFVVSSGLLANVDEKIYALRKIFVSEYFSCEFFEKHSKGKFVLACNLVAKIGNELTPSTTVFETLLKEQILSNEIPIEEKINLVYERVRITFVP